VADTVEKRKCNWTNAAVGLLVFVVLCTAGMVGANAHSKALLGQAEAAALELASETGEFLSDTLSKATLPLFSLAQFATEIPAFRNLPKEIGTAFQNGSLPSVQPDTPGASVTHRNVSHSSCMDPDTVQRFQEIAATVRQNAGLPPGVLVTLIYVPQLVVCMAHPMFSTDAFPDGVGFNATPSIGIDFGTDPLLVPQIPATLNEDNDLYILGPITLRQCLNDEKACDPVVKEAFVARLPVALPGNDITVNGTTYKNRWGFVIATINWTNLVESSGLYERFASRGHEFLLTRNDRLWGEADKTVVLARSPGFEYAVNLSDTLYASTTLMAQNKKWDIVVLYNVSKSMVWKKWVFPIVIVFSLCIALLTYTMLVQKQRHIEMLGLSRMAAARVELERNMTAY